MSERNPTTFDFTNQEAMVVRQVFDTEGKMISIRKVHVIRRMQAAMLLTSTPATRGKLTIRLTPLGREAWINHGLRTARRPLVRLME
jgi:hypothetical protein